MKIIKSEKGFTIIELLLAVAIVSVLASLFIFKSTQAKEKAQDAKMISESHQVEIALDMYKEETGFMPLSVSSSAGSIYTEDTDEYAQNLQPLVNKGLMSSIPKSSDGKSYAYGVSTDKKNAIFVVKLKNGQIHSTPCNLNECPFIIQPPDACGEPPFIASIGTQYYGADTGEYLRDINATDPEGKDIIFDLESSTANSPDSCFVSGNTAGCAFVSNTEHLEVTFSYKTENCPIQTDYLPIDNPNYIPSLGTYTLTIEVGEPSGNNSSISLYKLIYDEQGIISGEEPIAGTLIVPEGETVHILASAIDTETREPIALQSSNCSQGEPTVGGITCDVTMDSDKTIYFSEQ